jgi:MFS transporter, SP family, general alpha glucoside:H+ symporter
MAAEKTSPDAIQVESADTGLSHLKDAGLHDKALANQALEGTVQEHNVGVWQALKTHKRAAFWSIRMCTVPMKQLPLT